jgi:hypothetical protein
VSDHSSQWPAGQSAGQADLEQRECADSTDVERNSAIWDGYEADPEKLRADWITQIDNVVGRLFPNK